MVKIVLYGGIGEKIDGDYVGQMISGLSAEDEIEVRINSAGGSVLEGYSIYSALVNSPAKVNVFVDYLAGSIASIIMLAGDTVNISANGRVMIHKAYIPGKKLNSKQISAITAINEDLKMLLMNRTGNNEEWVNSVFSATEDTWISAKDALEFGLVDNIIPILKRAKNELEDELSMNTEEFLEVYNQIIEREESNEIYTTTEKYIQKPIILKMDKVYNVLDIDIKEIAEDKVEDTVLNKVETILAEVDTIKAEVADLKLENDGLEKTVASLESTKVDLEDTIAKYKEAEVEAFEAEVQNVIDEAVKAEKFTSDEDKEFYTDNLKANFEKTKSVIARIPGKVLLTEVIEASAKTETADIVKDDIPVV